MKVYTEVVIDMTTGQCVSEESISYFGPVAYCLGSKGGGGGGGMSGSVDYASWIKNRWIMLMDRATGDPVNVSLNTSTFDLVNKYLTATNNPYYNAAPFDPNAAHSITSGSVIDRMHSKYNSVSSDVDNFSPRTEHGLAVDQAIADAADAYKKDIDYINNLSQQIAGALQAAVDAIDSAPIDNEVQSYENSLKNQHLRTVARFAAGMADINAVNSSAFVIGMALLEREYSNEVSSYRAKLNLQMYDSVVTAAIRSHLESYIRRYAIRDTFVADAAARMLQLQSNQLSWKLALVQYKGDIERITYIMEKERTERDISLDVSYAQWEFDTVQFAANIMAGLSGGTMGTVQQEPSVIASTIGGAMSGASVGAGIGTAIAPGTGTAIGAIVGAVAGGVMGYYE